MSLPAIPRSLAERLKAALERRLYPNSALHRKQLSYALQVSENTLDNWLSGNGEPRARHLLNLICFFDSSFAQEISDGQVAKIEDARVIAALKKISEGREELAALGGKP